MNEPRHFRGTVYLCPVQACRDYVRAGLAQDRGEPAGHFDSDSIAEPQRFAYMPAFISDGMVPPLPAGDDHG